MRMVVWREFTFDAAHWLPKVPPGHKCGRIHGHTWRVRVSVGGPAINGMVLDYADLEEHWREAVHATLDHKLLNEIDGLSNPTTEVIAPWIWDRLCPRMAAIGKELVEVAVQEGDRSGCVVQR